MQAMTHRDVQYAVLLLAQAAETGTKLYPTSLVAEELDRLGTAALQLAQIGENDRDADEALLETIGKIRDKADRAVLNGGTSAIWRLIRHKAEVADAFVRAYRDQQAARVAPGIDERGND